MPQRSARHATCGVYRQMLWQRARHATFGAYSGNARDMLRPALTDKCYGNARDPPRSAPTPTNDRAAKHAETDREMACPCDPHWRYYFTTRRMEIPACARRRHLI